MKSLEKIFGSVVDLNFEDTKIPFWDLLTFKDNAISKAVDIMEGMDETKTEGINVLKNKGIQKGLIELYQNCS